jgi:hypothetical protein
MLLSKMQPLLNKSSDFYENLIKKFIFTQDNQTRPEIDSGQINIYVRLILIYLIIIGFILLLLIRLKN